METRLSPLSRLSRPETRLTRPFLAWSLAMAMVLTLVFPVSHAAAQSGSPSGVGLTYETGWGSNAAPHLAAEWSGQSAQYDVRWFYDQTPSQIVASGFGGPSSSETVSDRAAELTPNEPGTTQKQWCVAVRSTGNGGSSDWAGPACAYALKCSTRLVTVMVGRGETATAGDDSILGTNGADVISALGGDDYVCARGGDDEVYGQTGADHIYGSTGNDVVYGGPGNDRLYGSEGNDELHGEAGVDYLNGSNGEDRLFGGDGDDTLLGYRGRDTLYGGAGNDYLGGHSADDELWGGNDDDRLYGHAGDDVLRAGPGDDLLYGSAGADQLFGDSGLNELWGGDGDDVLLGGGNDDQLYGQADNDQLVGAAGTDYGNGGSGTDTCEQIETVFRCTDLDVVPVIDYWIDCGAGGANLGTEAAPFTSIADANAVIGFTDYDNLIFAGGTQCESTESLVLNQNDVAVFQRGAAGSPSLTIDAQGQQHGPPAVVISGERVALYDLHIDLVNPATVSCGGSAVDAGSRVGISIEAAGYDAYVAYTRISGFYAGVTMRGSSGHLQYNEITANQMMNGGAGAMGVLIWGDQNEVTDNTFADNFACSTFFGQDGASVEIFAPDPTDPGAVGMQEGPHSTRIRRNTTTNDQTFVEMGAEAQTLPLPLHWTEITDNTFVSTQPDASFVVLRGSGTQWGPPAVATVIDANIASVPDAQGDGVICDGDGCDTAVVDLFTVLNRNTICAGNWALGWWDASGTEQLAIRNLC